MRKISKGNVTIKLWDIGGQPRWVSFVCLFVCFVFVCLFFCLSRCLSLCLFDQSDGCGVAEDNADAKGTFVDIKGMLAMVMMMTIMMGVVLMNNELLRVSQELL